METFEQLASETIDKSPQSFLTLVKEKKLQPLTDYFIFNNDKNSQQFYQSLEFLADDGIWSKDELDGYTFISQTIDNDYVLSNTDKTLVIPYSFYKSDSELFNLTVFDFFKQMEEGILQSNIISI
ncbi:hypothetical protein JNUCC83_01630 [Vagococcus sp. JNUCC 83]